jgi:predicted signal transduction protein with EAL and GGDEF domain
MGIGPEAIHVGASIGVALYPENGMTVTQLLDAAERDMYSQKFDRKSELSPLGGGQTPPSAD